ncbi:MAG: PIN domain-containing protein [Alcaligenaceae bacterium]|nr:PIN domain-containing protein [Alcaligenaceae bacterium]
MTGVLVDTSVWVDHFKRRNDALVHLLERDLVLTHPLVIGEIACGTPPSRQETLADLASLRQSQQASIQETMMLIEARSLYGSGCGVVDILLPASTLLTHGAELWTLDKRLDTLAEQIGIKHQPVSH